MSSLNEILFYLIATVLVFAALLYMVNADEATTSDEKTHVRERRDGYSGYGSGYNTGSYGCSCPYVQCDNQTNGLMAFGVGALLGLLLALLRNILMMAAPAPAPAPATGRFFAHGNVDADAMAHSDFKPTILVDYNNNVTWKDSNKARSAGSKSTLMELLHLPANFGDDLGPVMADLLRIYTDGGKHPECLRRWICEATRDVVKVKGISSKLASLSSLAIAWYSNDITPIIQTILPQGRQMECDYLSPKCEFPLKSG
ncbi:hypothetical protein CHUAL_006936 [Chamberlinius hualienensis]